MKSIVQLLGIIIALLLCAATPIEALAEEPLLPAVDKKSFEGEWEGAWSDRSGRIFVAYLNFKRKDLATVVIASGIARPFVTVFKITEASFQNGAVKIEAAGTDEERGHHLVLSGDGWAVADIGFVRLVIEKRNSSGEFLLKHETVLYKAPKGFVRSAAKLLDFARLKRGKAR